MERIDGDGKDGWDRWRKLRWKKRWLKISDFRNNSENLKAGKISEMRVCFILLDRLF